MLDEVLAFAALPIAAAVVLTGIHTWLGLQVLRRNVVFADLALAQIAALGATAAVVAGHAVSEGATYAYSFGFAAVGALLLTASRRLVRTVRQEAFIGVLYVVATAATVLVVDRSPQGAEHVKRMLLGSILSVTSDELAKLTALYLAVGALHWFIRRPLLAAAEGKGDQFGNAVVWDLIFYLSFALVVTSSVSIAGVLLVFCFLIVPALIGSLFSSAAGLALAIGWFAGTVASIAGILGSFVLDAPTGALTVVTFALVLLIAGMVRGFITATGDERGRRVRIALRGGVIALAAAAVLSGVWAILAPHGDHPALAVIEAVTGIAPERYLSARERADFIDAAAVERRHQAELDRLNEVERKSRWDGAELSADELRRIGSVQQSLTEMGRGERFVIGYLSARARERERWYVGLPLAIIGCLVLALVAHAARAKSRVA